MAGESGDPGYRFCRQRRQQQRQVSAAWTGQRRDVPFVDTALNRVNHRRNVLVAQHGKHRVGDLESTPCQRALAQAQWVVGIVPTSSTVTGRPWNTWNLPGHFDFEQALLDRPCATGGGRRQCSAASAAAALPSW